MSTTKTITPDCPSPINIFRVGKYKPDKIRHMKTPYQQAQFQNLKEELQRRIEKGEENLRIRYIKNVPKIITIHSKKIHEIDLQTRRN
ncbi:unnamed protein product [Leptidea sinapis]|uniref:Uncharacterized protein n=1 Tax=Leptidea sinapis TaxID=189913 RepID=A0A5E4Q9X4_9NEOP|nr:unnamed protein product [Leptidea sinapis]